MIRRRVGGRDTYTPVGADRAAAERALARSERASHETMEQAVEAWLAMKRADPKARPNSVHVFESRARKVTAYFEGDEVRHIRASDLIAFVDDHVREGFAPATVQGYYHVLTATLRHAQRRGVISSVPLPPDGPGIPTVHPRSHDLTLDQVEEVIGRMVGVWGKVAELVLLTGLRWGEVTAIRAEDIDGKILHVRRTRNRYGSVNDPKTRSGRRVVPLSRRARTILRGLELPVGGDYRRAREALVHAMGDLHKPGMGWHTIRAAHATLLDVNGVSLRETAARMGHGHNHAQTLAYHVRSEVGSADSLDRLRRQRRRASARPSAARGEPASLEEARARRRRAR